MSNQLPDGWSLRKLGSTIDVLIAGQSPNRKEFPARAGEYGILKTTAIDWGHFKPQCNQEVLDDFKPNLKHEVVVDDILITKAGPVHRVGVVAHVKSTPTKILVSGKMTLMRVKKEYSSSFIAYALSTEYSQKPLKDGTTGMASSQTNFTHDTLKEIPIFVPTDKNEQQKIAAILTSVDDVIEKTQSQINKLKDLKTGMMQELLTRGVGVDGKPHTEFKDSPVGRIPKAWDVDIIGNLFFVQLGKMLSKASKVSDSPMPYLGNKNIQWGRFALDDIETMDFTEKEKHKFSLKRGDLLMCEGGEVGRCAIWMDEITNCYYQKAIHRLRPINSMYDPVLLMEYMKFAKQSGLLVDYISQTSIAHLTKEKLVSIPVPVPTQVEQQEIVMVLKAISKRINSAELKLAKNIQLKKALMQDLLTGKVRVNVD